MLGNKAYNSAAWINDQGQIITMYRKHYRYYTDLTWSTPGPGFSNISLSPFGNIGLGICMDLNHEIDLSEQEMLRDWYQPPFATWHAKHNTQFIVLLMNWLKSDEELPFQEPKEPSWRNLEYWCRRLAPLVESRVPREHPVIVVTCNRTGAERGTFLLPFSIH